MEVDPTQSKGPNFQQKAEALQSLTAGSIPSSVSKISGSSRGIPSGKDFHFYYNFDEFKAPIDEIAAKSHLMLAKIGSSKHLWDTEVVFPEDIDDAYDLVVNINEEILERFDMSLGEFSKIRKAEEDGSIGKAFVDDDGFQLVCGKKKKATGSGQIITSEANMSSPAVRVAERDKKSMGGNPKVPFHIPTVRRPQDEYNILVNNANQPFQHVWLQKSDDGSRFIHPLENLSCLDFVDRNVENLEPLEPPPLESTPFKLVEEVKDLKELAAKLRAANEFAVDLEHNQYRSFQGLTCLMQISTRTEDFVVDTLKLRIQIGPYLREVFKDPAKKKVMHGADWDILWLQRDFGIYVCNLFDTGQASRILKLERNSLEYLLQHFCGVTANKEYQKADWRLRPLPHEMMRYAREDTHHLLYIYDMMRNKLLSEASEYERSDALLREVYERSYTICMQLYEKELLTECSYLRIYGLQGANLNAQQLAIVAGLWEWRDIVARAEDESTGFILPNKFLLEIAKQMPVTTSKLKRLLKSKLPYVERNLGSVVSIIRHAMQNAAEFEPVVQQLREAAIQTASGSNAASLDAPNVLNPSGTSAAAEVKPGDGFGGTEDVHENGNVQMMDISKGLPKVPEQNAASSSLPEKMVHIPASVASVHKTKKPNRAFGALLGNSTTKKKSDPQKGKEEIKLEQIKSSVGLRFHTFSGTDQPEQTNQAAAEPSRLRDHSQVEEGSVGPPSGDTVLEDIIELVDGSRKSEGSPVGESAAAEERNDGALVLEEEDEPMSLSDLSSSFRKFFKPTVQNEEKKGAYMSAFIGFKPFDYAAARKQVKFGERPRREEPRPDGSEETKSMKRLNKKTGILQTTGKDEGTIPQGKRREAFPASGNRSTTFR